MATNQRLLRIAHVIQTTGKREGAYYCPAQEAWYYCTIHGLCAGCEAQVRDPHNA